MSPKPEPGQTGASDTPAVTSSGTSVTVKDAGTKDAVIDNAPPAREAAGRPAESTSAESKSGQRELKKRKGQFLVAPPS